MQQTLNLSTEDSVVKKADNNFIPYETYILYMSDDKYMLVEKNKKEKKIGHAFK